MRVGIAGLSHLGLVTGICLASKGFEVIGFDEDSGLVDDLCFGCLPVSEPDLPELLYEANDKVRFTDLAQDLADCDVIYIARDVPTDDQNISRSECVESLLSTVVDAAGPGTTVVVHSQVSPGFTREFVNRFGKLLDEKNLQVYYQVETLVFGNAVKRALEPERYIIGCVDANAELSTAYRALLRKFDCPILQMRYESAELAKISINMFLVSSVTTTNSIAELCENIGADWEEIAGALRLDRRIGQHAYLKPGLGIAGGNLERDLVTFQNFAARYGTDSGVVESWIENSRYRAGWVLRVLHEIVFSIKTKPRIAIWGVAYKAGTHSVKNSPSLGLIETLTSFDLCVCDPVVSPSCVEGAGVEWAESALDCCRAADVLVIMTPWPEYSELDPTLVAQAMAGKLVIDPYTALDRLSCESAGLEYKSLGVAVSQDQFLADGKSKESDK